VLRFGEREGEEVLFGDSVVWYGKVWGARVLKDYVFVKVG